MRKIRLYINIKKMFYTQKVVGLGKRYTKCLRLYGLSEKSNFEHKVNTSKLACRWAVVKIGATVRNLVAFEQINNSKSIFF